MKWYVLTSTRGLDERQQPTTDGLREIALEAENLAFGQAGALVMRLGLETQALTSSGITGGVQWLGRFVTNAGVEELWACSNNSGTANLARRASGTWSTVSFSDTVNVTELRNLSAAALDGRLSLSYDSDVNRHHVWDGASVRRMGISKPSAPTVADQGSGSYAANARRYRVSFLIKSGSDVIAHSELSDATATFTPSGSGAAARVTKPTTPDSATHWRVWGIAGSTDTYTSYENISGDIAVGTTTYDDSTAPASYDGDFPPQLGQHIPPPSAKYVLSDGTRFIFANGWESSGSAGQTAPKPNRVWFTPALGASDLGDTERIPDTTTQFNKLDIGDAGPITGLAGPLYGDVYVFKADSVWKMVPTADEVTPFRAVLVTSAVGAVGQRAIVMSEDGEGVPSIYFASRTAVYQIVNGGIREISEPVRRDLRMEHFTASGSLLGWDPLEKTLFVQTKEGTPPTSGLYYQFLYDVASDRWSGATFGTFNAGWVLGTGGRSVLGSTTTLTDQSFVRASTTTQDTDGVPRLLLGGQTANPNAAGTIFAWGGQGGADGTSAFTARTRWRLPLGAQQGRRFRVGHPTVVYTNPVGTGGSAATLTISLTREDGDVQTQSQTLETTPADDPLGQKRLTFEGLSIGDAFVVDLRLQLSYAASWTGTTPAAIHSIWLPYEVQEEVPA